MADKIVVLNVGRIEQAGSPLDLYRAPRNRFVAGFISSPKLSFIEGAAAASHGAPVIGIRPEHIAVSATGGQSRGTVDVSEHPGSDTFFRVHGTGLADCITHRAGGGIGLTHGDTVRLTPDMTKLRRFDAAGLAQGAAS